MRPPFFSARFVARLHERASENQSSYGDDHSWLDTFAGGQPYRHESNLVVDPPPELRFDGDDADSRDAENAMRVYQWLRKLTPAIAMEERLWAYLTHVTFAEYMAKRWPPKNKGAVERRYLFEGGSFSSLARNGIARLWWAGYLTIDEKRDDPFELTRTLFLRQDIQVSLLERSLGKCRGVRHGVLEYLRVNESWLSSESFGKRIQFILKELNLLGGVAVLDALPPDGFQAALDAIGRRSVEDDEGAAAA